MKKVMLAAFTFTSISMLSAQENDADEKAILNLLHTIETGWNEKSGDKFSSAFYDVHDYIVVNGLYFPQLARKDNAAIHQRLFDGPYKNNNIRLQPDKVRFYRKDLAQVTAIGANYVATEGVPKDPTAIMTIVVEKKNNAWKIISFHNHDLNMEIIKRASPAPVEVMYASWYKK